MLKIIDQTRTIRTLKPSQVLGKVPAARNSVATDADGTAINKGDTMKEVQSSVSEASQGLWFAPFLADTPAQAAGRAEPRTGQVLHTYHSLFAFLYNRDYTENGGVFVVYAQQLTSESLRAKVQQQARDTTKQNPDTQLMPPPPVAVAGTAAKPKRDRLLGQRVKIAGPGAFKGKEGRVKDINPTSQLCRIELSATNKIVTVHKSKCMMVASM